MLNYIYYLAYSNLNYNYSVKIGMHHGYIFKFIKKIKYICSYLVQIILIYIMSIYILLHNFTFKAVILYVNLFLYLS